MAPDLSQTILNLNTASTPLCLFGRRKPRSLAHLEEGGGVWGVTHTLNKWNFFFLSYLFLLSVVASCMCMQLSVSQFLSLSPFLFLLLLLSLSLSPSLSVSFSTEHLLKVFFFVQGIWIMQILLYLVLFLYTALAVTN